MHSNNTLEKWEEKPFEKCIENIQYTNKIPKKDFKEHGLFPIISQEEEYISGYWDDEDDLFKIKKPIVIFGDHTKNIKYVDFDFVLGADGVKIISTIDDILPRYMYYYLQNIQLRNLGYARHYKLLKEKHILYPPLSEQQRIVGILDKAFENIEKAKQNTLQNLNNAKELFESYANKILFNEDNCIKTTIGETCSLMTGGTPDTKNEEYYKNGTVKWLVSGDIHLGEITDCNGRITEIGLNNSNAKYLPVNSVLIALNGQGKTRGTVALLKTKATCNQSLVSIYPNDEKQLSTEYLYQNLRARYMEIRRMTGDSGNDRRGLNMPLIRSIKINIPNNIETQLKIAEKLKSMQNNIKNLEQIYTQKLQDLDELKQSLLQKAFNGEL